MTFGIPSYSHDPRVQETKVVGSDRLKERSLSSDLRAATGVIPRPRLGEGRRVSSTQPAIELGDIGLSVYLYLLRFVAIIGLSYELENLVYCWFCWNDTGRCYFIVCLCYKVST